MKKKCIPLTLAFLMAFSQAVPAFAAEAPGEWVSGWTGKAGSTEYSVDISGDSFVLSNNKVNNGKFTDGEDSIIYAAKKISGEEDFTFSATVSIDSYSVMEESSNPQQGSVGIAVLDELYNKTDDIAYTDSLFLGSYAPDKKSEKLHGLERIKGIRMDSYSGCRLPNLQNLSPDQNPPSSGKNSS